MRNFLLVSGLLTLGGSFTSGSTITISMIENLGTIAGTQSPVIPWLGEACVDSSCNSIVPPSLVQPQPVSVTNGTSSGQASVSGPTDPSKPLIFAASGQITTPPTLGSPAINQLASYHFDFDPSTSTSTTQVFPSFMVDFDPGGIAGTAGAYFRETTNTTITAFAFSLTGTSPAAFIMDPSSGTMSLTATAADVGEITLDDGAIDFIFQNGVVSTSTNSLGLALPSVGSSADFSLTGLGPFQFPGLSPASGAIFDISEDSTLSPPTVPTPETGTIALTFVGIALFFARRKGEIWNAGGR